jgi:hypothetical protein
MYKTVNRFMQRQAGKEAPRRSRKLNRGQRINKRIKEKQQRIAASQPLISELQAHGIKVLSTSPGTRRLLAIDYRGQKLAFEHASQVRTFLARLQKNRTPT